VLGHSCGGVVYATGGRVGAVVLLGLAEALREALGFVEALGLGDSALVFEAVTSSRRPATT
jgi:hypothetical protein